MEGQKLNVTIKKVKKVAGGHHGGSWKVAFADFMTAMMAFFLLMWLLSMGPQKKKEELANYFKTFSIFGDGGSTSQSVVSDESSPGNPPKAASSTSPAATKNATEGETQENEDEKATETEMEAMKERLQQEIKSRLTGIEDQVVINKFDGGIKIDIMDKTGKPMFKLGSTELTDNAKRVLAVISENIKDSTHKLEIEGHTDAVGFASENKYGNWELSTARASAARVELEKDGISSALLVRVSGYADTEPLIKDNPFDPRNRRISLRLLYPKTNAPAEGEAPDSKPPAGATTSPEPPIPPPIAPIEPIKPTIVPEH